MRTVTIVGGGLAGCEAAWQLAERGIEVLLLEQKPHKRTPAQTGNDLAELVCSNSMRGAALSNAVGLLKEELRRAGSVVIATADRTRVPAGGALAVDRERFSAEMSAAMASHPRIRVVSEEVTSLPEARPLIVATGPLTGDALAADLARVVGAEHLAYYDAIAPIIAADSIAWDQVFRQSRYDKGEPGEEGAYVNCPFDEAGYRAFVAAVVAAEKVAPRSFEEVRYFEGCLPVEVMAERGEMTLAFGPMKPVGLVDPRTGRRPFAVIQLRAENADASAYNLVGFQTRMTYGEQARVFRTIPGLAEAEFLRFGSVHRNTFLHAPELLDATMQLRALPGVFIAGQLSGVEGYVESAAGGFICALLLGQRLCEVPLTPPPPTTALGGICTHLARKVERYQPSNITWAHLPPLGDRHRKKRERYEAMAERALEDLEGWMRSAALPARRAAPLTAIDASAP
ncbi:MAG TPA: methylenetetrahydrofolate--tRNA-(uracil(54)-C(5))-methyltransferase (FADH(2)-oxidizing) TrmFO [Polyangiaceae bacterium]|nr:methylenetetrahydrofolate--tRNA-(uracil(54)-C(5))-methyltransferase (FADH(2)-oxidizing) TrmFO [Polyangiaceae bacterium]